MIPLNYWVYGLLHHCILCCTSYSRTAGTVKKYIIIYSVHCVCNHLCTPTYANILYKIFRTLLHISMINRYPQGAVSAQEYIISVHQFYMYSVKNM